MPVDRAPSFFVQITNRVFFLEMSYTRPGGRFHYGGSRGYGHANNGGYHQSRQMRNLEEVICYKCAENGHFANKCPKGHLAFLNSHHNARPA